MLPRVGNAGCILKRQGFAPINKLDNMNRCRNAGRRTRERNAPEPSAADTDDLRKIERAVARGVLGPLVQTQGSEHSVQEIVDSSLTHKQWNPNQQRAMKKDPQCGSSWFRLSFKCAWQCEVNARSIVARGKRKKRELHEEPSSLRALWGSDRGWTGVNGCPAKMRISTHVTE